MSTSKSAGRRRGELVPGATTSWFFCGKCGFKNHPRMGQDNAKCEQCGAKRDDPETPATDYDPARSA